METCSEQPWNTEVKWTNEWFFWGRLFEERAPVWGVAVFTAPSSCLSTGTRQELMSSVPLPMVLFILLMTSTFKIGCIVIIFFLEFLLFFLNAIVSIHCLPSGLILSPTIKANCYHSINNLKMRRPLECWICACIWKDIDKPESVRRRVTSARKGATSHEDLGNQERSLLKKKRLGRASGTNLKDLRGCWVGGGQVSWWEYVMQGQRALSLLGSVVLSKTLTPFWGSFSASLRWLVRLF